MINIKHIIRSQKLRHRIMRLGKFFPDSIMISLQYRILLGRWPNLNNPKRFSEWIQWYKINCRDSKMLKCVDKYEVRDFVESKRCGEYLNTLFQICDSAEDIDFNNLPQKFVIKSTSGGSGDNVLIIRNKENIKIQETIQTVNSWLNKNYSDTSREWAYSEAAAHPRIIIEKYLQNDDNSLDDYKFFCFNGKCEYFKVDFNRYSNHQANYYSKELSLLHVTEEKFTPNPNYHLISPKDLKEMIKVAEKLASDFKFVRVDLYNVNGKIIFGELTFYPGSGYGKYTPDSYDFEFGKYFNK